ncbi:MAG: hemolysin family protein [Planctomycetota bacterium]
MRIETLVDNIPHLLAITILVAVSGLISGSETALFALRRNQLLRLRRANTRLGNLVLRLRGEPANLLSTVLLANIAVNILIFTMLAVTAVRLADGSTVLSTLFGAVGFVFMLLFAELIPKLVAFSLCDRLATVVAVPIRVLEIVTLPVRWLLVTAIVAPLTKIVSGTRPVLRTIRAEELQHLAMISQDEGVIDERENTLLHQVMELKDSRVGALMVPRVDIVAFNLAHDTNELLELFKSSRLLRIPVYEGDIDNIKGYISAKQFVLDRDKPLQGLVSPIRFIPEQASVEALLQHFRTTRSKIAIVVDEYGGVAGIVALEDVVEAIVGELYSPEEVATLPPIVRVSETTFLVDAGLDVDEFRRAFALPVEETRINTVGGLIAQMLHRVPQRGDRVGIGSAWMTVIAMHKRRILRIRLTLESRPRDNPDLTLLLERVSARRRPSSTEDENDLA